MMRQEHRKCIICNYDVMFCEIEDRLSPTVFQFVALERKGKLKDYNVVTDNCPKCGNTLTLKTTKTI